jgi:hypothetical protein
MRPKVPANVGGKPEPVEAEGDQLQESTANDQTPESAVPSGKLHRRPRPIPLRFERCGRSRSIKPGLTPKFASRNDLRGIHFTRVLKLRLASA